MKAFAKYLVEMACGIALVVFFLAAIAWYVVKFCPAWSAGQDAWRTSDPIEQ